MKDPYQYLLGSDEEIQAHLRAIRATNFKAKAEGDLHEFCFQTAINGDVSLMTRIITRYPIITGHINTYLDGAGNTILYRAALADQPKMVQFLLDHGADPNIRTVEGQLTPLESICLNYSGNFTDSVKTVINLLLSKTNPDMVNALLEFLETNQTNYPGIYEQFLTIVQEFRLGEDIDMLLAMEDSEFSQADGALGDILPLPPQSYLSQNPLMVSLEAAGAIPPHDWHYKY